MCARCWTRSGPGWPRSARCASVGASATKFDGPGRAVECAGAIRAGVRSLGLEIRAGVHTGEFERVDGKLGGIGVSTGARIAALAGPGEILVSGTVKELVAASEIEFEDRGLHELKGVPGEWRLFASAG